MNSLITSATACDFDAADEELAAVVAWLLAEAEPDPCGVFDRTISAHDFGAVLMTGVAAAGEPSADSAG